MSITKRFKNNSGVDKFVLTRTISNNEYIDIPFKLWVEILDDSDIISDVNGSVLIVNDGVSDLSPTDGIIHLNKFQENVSDNFSYQILNGTDVITIPDKQQMIVHDMSSLGDDSELIIEGELVII